MKEPNCATDRERLIGVWVNHDSVALSFSVFLVFLRSFLQYPSHLDCPFCFHDQLLLIKPQHNIAGWYKYERNKQCFREEHAVNYTTSCGVECHSCLVFRPCEGISTDRLQKNLADVDGGEEPSATISEQDPLFSFDHQASAEKEEAATTAAGAMPLESLSSSAIPNRTEMMAKTKPTVATFVFPLLLAAMIMVLW